MVLGLADRLDEQIAEEREAIDLEPDNLDARIGLASALHKKGQKEEAIKELQVVLKKEPGNTEAKAILVRIK
jgi:thioredoxin-like negative regulator of GroEL